MRYIPLESFSSPEQAAFYFLGCETNRLVVNDLTFYVYNDLLRLTKDVK